MKSILKLSTASQIVQFGPFVSDTDGVTAQSGLTIANTDIKLLKHGSTSSANKNSGGATHIVNGFYYATFDATDTNTQGRLVVTIKVAGAAPVWFECFVADANTFDALVSSTGVGLRGDVQGWLGTAPTTPNTAGQPLVDLNRWRGTQPNALQSGRVDSYIGAIASGIIAAASFASGALDAVWSTTTRLLTAGSNIVLAKGTGITGFNDLDAAGIRSATGLASANLDTQLGAIAGYIDTEVGAIKAKTDNLPADPASATNVASAQSAIQGDIAALPTAGDNAAATLDEVVDGTRSLRQLARGWTAALLGKVSGMADNHPVFRNIDDDTDVIDADTTDDGDRTSVTLDLD
jgi:hypothetical protein